MAGQIIANASKLFALDDGLKNTTSQVDSVIADNDELIRNTSNQISDVLEVWKERQTQAYEKLDSAQEALAKAKAAARDSKDGDVPYYYYQAVALCQAEYDEVSGVCTSIERINNDFLAAASSYKRTIESSRQEYIGILQKSSYVLIRYAELVRKSSSIGQSTSGHSDRSTNNSFDPRVTNQQWTDVTSSGEEQIGQRTVFEIMTLKNTLELTDGDPTIVQAGGVYRDIKKSVDSKRYEVHHIPPQSVFDEKFASLPAIAMLKEDHAGTSSFRGRMGKAYTSYFPSEASDSRYKQEITDLINRGMLAEAIRNEIYEIRNAFGSKYDGAIQQYLDSMVKYITENGMPKSV